MIKSIIKKNIKFYSKLALLIGVFIVFICSFGVSTFAYTENDDGNLISDNLINYQDINSSNFIDLGNGSFKLNWGGAVSTITLPYNDFNVNTQYSLTITKLNGANYWAYQFYWNYSDNTRERFTNNQGVGNGTYSYTSALNKTLSSITIVLNYEADFKDLMLNVGTPLKYEKYGAIYYSQSNYNSAYNQGVNSVFDGLRDFNAIQSYYSISTLFYSTDGGSSYSNLNSLGYTGQYVVDGNLLVEMDDSHDWAYGSNIIYYLDIQFTTSIYIANLYLPSIQRPNPVSVQFSDFSYDFNYTMVDGVGYFVTRNIYKITDNLRFYFTAYADMPHEFEIIIKGFNSAIDTYESGFNDGVDSLKNTIDGLNENIQVLKTQNATLKTQLEHGNSSWTSLFFAMADTPFKTASNFLGFEIFGVNLFNALIGFITILAIFWVFKRLIK